MKQIGITRIEVTNPMIEKYLDTIKFWDETKKFMPALINEQSQTPNSFLGIFYGDQFLGASVYKINQEKSKANIQMINGSIQHQEEIEKYFSNKVLDFLTNRYGEIEVTFEHLNRIEKNAMLTKIK